MRVDQEQAAAMSASTVKEPKRIELVLPIVTQILFGLLLLYLSYERRATIWELPKPSLEPLLLAQLDSIYSRLLAGSAIMTLVGVSAVWLNRREKLWFHIGFGWLLFSFTLSRLVQFPVGADDSYHDYRYALHWSHLLSLDYNPGDPVMGFTSHLHVGLLALAAALLRGIPIDILSPYLSMIMELIALFFVVMFTRKEFRSPLLGLIAGIPFVSSGYLIGETWVGKETSLVVLLVLASLYCVKKHQWTGLAWTSCALFLTRPEGVIWLFTGLVWQACKTYKDRGWKTVLVWIPPLLIVAVWYAVLFIHYGTIVPHGSLGRASMYHSRFSGWDSALGYMILVIGQGTLGNLFLSTFQPLVYLLTTINFIPPLEARNSTLAMAGQAVIVYACLFALSRNLPYLRFYFYAVSGLMLFFALTNPWPSSWYAAWFSIIPSLILPMLIYKVWRSTTKRAVLLPLRIFGYWICFYILFAGFLIQPQIFIVDQEQERIPQYKHAAEFIKSLPNKPKEVATLEPGVLGYYLPDHKILDLGGLLSDAPLKYLPPPVNERTTRTVWCSIPTQAISEMKPECLVLLDCFADNGILKNREFLKSYKLVWIYPSTVWQSEAMFIYMRNNNPPQVPPSAPGGHT